MLLTSLLLLMAIGLAYLVIERARLSRDRSAIPLVIAVSGTRGKSSVTRILASVLRASGRRVLAKTTGSEAKLVKPDGSEETIRRRGRPSVIEQKHVVGLGAQLGVDVAVVEVMSIHAENHRVETRKILKPDLVVVTNFRVDHTSAMGDTREAVASVLALDIPPGAAAFVLQQECLPEFRAAVKEGGGELVEVPTGAGSHLYGETIDSNASAFGENLDLVGAVARSLGIDDATMAEGVRRTRSEAGALSVWRYSSGEMENSCYLVNAFAANDPESTVAVYDKISAVLYAEPGCCVGLVSLRPDRGDRTLQFLEAFRGGFLSRFSRLYIIGLHAQALARRLRRGGTGPPIEVLSEKRPAEITRAVLSGIRESGGVVFGFGNFGGAGEGLVKHWREVGERWGIES